MIRFHESLKPLLCNIDMVKPSPTNPWNGDTDHIVTSIQRNGMYRPVYAQSSTGHILAGNHTFAACVELGAKHIPVVWLDVDNDTATRIMLADNRIAELGRYDDGQLVALLKEASAADELGLLGTGFDVDDLKRLEESIAEPFNGDDEDHLYGLRHKQCPNCGFDLGGE